VDQLADQVTELWEQRDNLTATSAREAEAQKVVHAAIDRLDAGDARVAEVVDGEVVVHEWLKQAILLLFRLSRMETTELGPFEYADKIPLKHHYEEAGVRVVPGGSARWGSYVGRGSILMPSYVNIGAYVGPETMVDTWATVGSCAQIGRNVHLSGGAGIGGVLEPPNAVPVVVEDDAFIGSRSMVVEGARVRAGAKLGAGTVLTATTHVIDVSTGQELPRGEAPAWSVCVSGTRVRSFPGGDFGMPCVLVLRRLAEGAEHDRLALNQILRDHGVSG
jgi:2,3,4,5-tetrahydropyridine-2-carboxylate N-succinyltransferase